MFGVGVVYWKTVSGTKSIIEDLGSQIKKHSINGCFFIKIENNTKIQTLLRPLR